MRKTRVLFLCTHNSARSQMAEGLLRALGGERFEVASAGHQPTQVHPLAIQAMAEIGVDISQHRAKNVTEFLGQNFDYVVTLCGDDAPGSCPFFPGGKRYLHAPFPDPARGGLDDFRLVRDALRTWIERTFLQEGTDG
ncbi:MAG: arsenate reductase ArsC [Candidatus Bipolaricaulaceae bacterium]